MDSVEHVQSMLNARLHALQKAKVKALKLGTSAPPEFDQLDENLMLVENYGQRALQARSAKRRIWDTGASKGMSHIDSAVGKEMPGPSSSVSTGAGIVQTSAWFKERLPHGESMHVGMAETADTISAGQANMEHGVETLWIEPGSTPADRPGQCILRKRAPGKFSHVVIEGSH